MNIYKKRIRSSIYRKIYKEHYGPIPIDNQGRTYEIHHIDGDHSNNDPSNLKAVTIQEHYDIHYSQGDWAACLRMSNRMKISPEQKSDLARQNCIKMMAEGRNPLLNRNQSGRNNYWYDHTTYCFEHIDTMERVIATRHDFYTKYNLKANQITGLVTGKARTVHRWAIITLTTDGQEIRSDRLHKLKDHTVYTFKHRHTGEIVNMTRSELSNTYDICHRALSTLLKNPNKKRVKDWILIR